MRVATEQRESADDRQLTQPPPRLGGTDLFRGAMVILAAVIIGGLVLSRGIDDDGSTSAADQTEQDDQAATADDGVDPAAGTAADDNGTDDQTGGADATAETESAAGTGVTTGTSTDPTTDQDDTTDDSMSTDTTDTTTSPLDTVRAPAEVRTLVLNAGGPQGIAGRATELLQGASYLTSAAKNADLNGPSAIYYTEGYEAEAIAVASVFGPGLDTLVRLLDPANPPTADLQQATVIVVVGNDDAIAVP